jgi:hypothetical protein
MPRPNVTISTYQAKNIIAAIHHAFNIKLPLNEFITMLRRGDRNTAHFCLKQEAPNEVPSSCKNYTNSPLK